jgi:hypothetical protein
MKLASARSSILTVSLFLLGIGAFAFYMQDTLKSIFLYNIHINSIIIACILTGIFLIYNRIFQYNKEYSYLINFLEKGMDIKDIKITKLIYANISKNNRLISQNKIESILGGIEKRIDDYSALPKYLSGILIFLGLLGTFWGLSHTIGNVAEIIDRLGIEGSDTASSFVQLKNSLKIPLSGMGIAFGCSLFGLSGSLILGFFIINMRRVSDDFLEKVERWINKHTVTFNTINEANNEYHGKIFSMALLEKTIELIYSFQGELKNVGENRDTILQIQNEISDKILKLTEMIGNNNIVWANISSKLEAIEKSIGILTRELISSNERVIQSLGNDIRTVSKVLSAIIRD